MTAKIHGELSVQSQPAFSLFFWCLPTPVVHFVWHSVGVAFIYTTVKLQ